MKESRSMDRRFSRCLLLPYGPKRRALPPQQPPVRLAEPEIDPAQLDGYKAALKEEIAASVQSEP